MATRLLCVLPMPTRLSSLISPAIVACGVLSSALFVITVAHALTWVPIVPNDLILSSFAGFGISQNNHAHCLSRQLNNTNPENRCSSSASQRRCKGFWMEWIGNTNHSRGSTGSLSKANTPNTHSWTRRNGSPATNRSSASIPKANSRSANERFSPTPRERSRERC